MNTLTNQLEKYKSEILLTEKQFEALVNKEGLSKAFLAFAADNVVLNRNNTVFKGKKAVKAFFKSQSIKDIILNWTPDFVDVAASGDLGYTYGNYNLSAIDANGKRIKMKGIFHTVWKKQLDGNWRFVWD